MSKLITTTTVRKAKVYGTRSGAPFRKEDVQAIGEFIDKVRNKTPLNILKEITKHKTHVIYNYIEWNNEIAGAEYRLQQVRNIVNHITIEIKGVGASDVPLRAFFSVRKEFDGTPVYVDVHMTFSEDYYRLQVIQQAYTTLRNWRERYMQYEELQDVIAAISPFIK